MLTPRAVIITIAWLPETYAPTLLGYRAKALRKEMGDDTIMTEQERNARPFGEIVTEALLRPLREFFLAP